MKHFLILALCLFSLFAPARAQSPTLPSNSASIEGMVVKEPGSQPLKKVLLQVIAEDQKEGSNYTANTDSDGHFRVENVQPGRYRLYLERTGFVTINSHGRKSEGIVLTVQAGNPIEDLLFQMLPTAVITGRVVDEDGDPMPNVAVSVQKKRPGKSHPPEAAGDDRTNDLGEYRFSGLFPGQYFVAAVPPPNFRNFEHPAQDSPDTPSKPETTYLTTYYPGTIDSTQAAAIDLHAGDEMPVNFSLVPAKAYRVRGTVTGIPPHQKAVVQLISRGVGSEINAAEVAADGQFEVRGVAPGSYFVTAYSGSEGQVQTTRQKVTVVAADVEGVKLVPSHPFTVSGHVRFEGQPPKNPAQYAVYLRSSDAMDDSELVALVPSGISIAQVDRLGNFQWTNVNPGSYVVQVYGGEGPDRFLKSVTLADRDSTTGLTLAGPASVELVISSKSGALEGVVSDKDQPVRNATVVAVPEEKYRKLRERFSVASSDQNGRFLIRGLAPGSYTLFAWQDLEEGLYYDADFLKTQENNGTTLKVEEGSRQKIELKLSPVSDDWQ